MDVASISALVAAVGVIVGVAFAVLELRSLVRTRRTDLTMRVHSAWISEEMGKHWLKVWNLKFDDYTDYEEKYGSMYSENPENIALLAVINHFETMGYLMQQKMIDYELVAALPVSMTWNKVRPIVDGARVQLDDSRLYEMFEGLYNQMKKRGQTLQAQ